MLAIRLEDVGVSFNGQQIFAGINKVLLPGTVTMVTGKNGSGKSTLLKTVAKLLPPSEGSVRITDGEREIHLEKYRKLIAMITPELSLYGHLTASENLRFFTGQRGRHLLISEINRLFQRVGLDPKRSGDLTESFSTGMRGRLHLALAIAVRATLWLLDEPGANFDEAGTNVLLSEIERAKAEGKIVLLATNDKREEAIADEVVNMDDFSCLS